MELLNTCESRGSLGEGSTIVAKQSSNDEMKKTHADRVREQCNQLEEVDAQVRYNYVHTIHAGSEPQVLYFSTFILTGAHIQRGLFSRGGFIFPSHPM